MGLVLWEVHSGLSTGSSANCQGVPGAPRARRADTGHPAFRDRNFCANRGSLIEVGPAKPARAPFWEHPQALTLFTLKPLQNVVRGNHVPGFGWQRLCGVAQGKRAGQELSPQNLPCKNKPGSWSIGSWKWLVVEKPP